MIDFEWDEAKAASNLRKHKVSFDEAQSVFFDEYAQQFFDSDNSGSEDRFILLGWSIKSRLLAVVHCEINEGKLIRLISARKATSKEKTFYRGPSR